MNFVKTSMALMAAATVLAGNAIARDDGRYAGSPLKPWSIPSKAVRDCVARMRTVLPSRIPTGIKDGHYRVRLEGEWVMVPDDAVITEPNRAGRTMVWR